MLKARCFQYFLDFKQPSGTSRGVLLKKETWFIQVWDDLNSEIIGIGECGVFKGLSSDDVPEYENKLKEVCDSINNFPFWLSEGLKNWPSILFGLETALADLKSKGTKILFPNSFSQYNNPISINGLIWMGEKQFMLDQIKEKLESGFDCIKLKIGAIDFEEELSLLKFIREEFDENTITLRVDANGAFSPENAIEKLKRLADFKLHSIEQPIKAGQWSKMAKLCKETPLAIALDEELIGINDSQQKKDLIKTIQPQYIILKPSLHGGISGGQEWIDIANEHKIDWWITSALESNIGLNAIAQWTYSLNNSLPQGLGTGQLFTNNIDSPLVVKDGQLFYDQDKEWNLEIFLE